MGHKKQKKLKSHMKQKTKKGQKEKDTGTEVMVGKELQCSHNLGEEVNSSKTNKKHSMNEVHLYRVIKLRYIENIWKILLIKSCIEKNPNGVKHKHCKGTINDNKNFNIHTNERKISNKNPESYNKLKGKGDIYTDFDTTVISECNVEKKKTEELKNVGRDCVTRKELKTLLSTVACKPLLNEADCHKINGDETQYVDKDSPVAQKSNICNIGSIFDHHGFTRKMQNQPWTVFTLDIVQNRTDVCGIPWAWFREEKWRLHTFAKYPHNTAKSAILLAEAGFVYIGSGKDADDTVTCFFCRGMKQAWREDENILEVHRHLSRDCAMVTGIGGCNIPLIPADVSFAFSNTIETDSCPEPNQESGRTGPTRKQAVASQVRANKPKAPVQLATQTVMCGTSSAQPMKQGVEDHHSAGNRIIRGQASDESGASSVLTSSNTVPPVPRSEAALEQASVTQSGGAKRPEQSASPRPQNPAPAGQSISQRSGMGSEPPRNVPDGGDTSGQANPTSTSTIVSQSSTSITTQSSTATTSPQSLAPTNSGQVSTQSSTQSSTSSNQSSTPSPNAPAVSHNPSYLELGIITERPKRYEYAVRFKRLETFGDWPRDHHLKKEDLADAGFYYAGYGDCARCFYCGGGLRNWEKDDDVWVEHARWFSKCAFIRQRLGQVFIDTVAHLAQTNDKINFRMVVTEMNIDPSAFQIDSKENPLKNDAAVLALCDVGYQESDILPVAVSLKENGQILSADLLFNELEERGVPRPAINVDGSKRSWSVHRDKSRDEELLNNLKQTNNDLRLQTLCKICMDKEVAVVFLPCGHLVCCTECASAMKDCPVCRNQVKGIVRAFMG